MRLFAAIELSDEARAAIAGEQQKIVAGLGGRETSLKVVRPEQMHLTLVFVGESDDVRSRAIVEAMTAAIPLAPFELVFGGVGVFPPRGAPRVLWLGVLEGAREAIDVQAHVARRLSGFGVALEARPYKPHLTLGRWRDSSRRSEAPRVTSLGDGRSGRPSFAGSEAEVARTRVDAVTLYQSKLLPGGPSYTALAHAPLTWS